MHEKYPYTWFLKFEASLILNKTEALVLWGQGSSKKPFLFVLRFTAQSTQWGHVERGQFT